MPIKSVLLYSKAGLYASDVGIVLLHTENANWQGPIVLIMKDAWVYRYIVFSS